jgi:RimJ/RimL family protein N-acetyltransferase
VLVKAVGVPYDADKMQALLREANTDPAVKGFVYPDEPKRKRLPIYCESQLVGFATPRQDPDQVWRMGAIYVTPAWRGRGLVAAAIAEFMRGKSGRAFIDTENVASQRAYSRAGFRLTKSVPDKGGAWWQNY